MIVMKFIPTFFCIILFSIYGADACTTAIVSGNFTPDGRPLLLKHRDTSFDQNALMYFNDGKYRYIGLINAEDPEGREVWAGFNSAGFAIMNSESYNLNISDTTRLRDMEGVLMKKALQTCATVDEFETFLKNYSKPRGVRANFGVIDAHGGAAYFETGNFKVVRIDVNDQAVAPFGYVIRTNFSATGAVDEGYGYIRYQTADMLFSRAAATGNLTYRFMLEDVSRSLYHSLTEVNLYDEIPSDAKSHFVYFEDFIPRSSSVATAVIQGVKSGEPAGLTTMWTIPGFQLCTVAVPVWLTPDGDLPALVRRSETGVAPLCDMALELKKKCFPVTRGSGRRYIDLAALLNRDGSGILQKILPLESEILDKGEYILDKWRQSGFSVKDALEFYDWFDDTVQKAYREYFGFSVK
jgi:hypothetical protein